MRTQQGLLVFPLSRQKALHRREHSPLGWLGSAVLAQSQGSPPLHPTDSLQPTGVGPGVTPLQNRQVTPTSASGHLYFFGFPPTHDSGISHRCPSICALPSTTTFKHLSAMAPGWQCQKAGPGSLCYPGAIPSYPSSAQCFPSPFLAAEPQFRVICVRSAKQTFVLQTELTEPVLDLYFSVCIWTPSPCRWKLMSSLSPGIRSERRNCTAIWSSSAQRSHRKLSLQLRIKL